MSGASNVQPCEHAFALPITAAYDGSPALQYSGLIVGALDPEYPKGPAYVEQVYWCTSCGAVGIQNRATESPRWRSPKAAP